MFICPLCGHIIDKEDCDNKKHIIYKHNAIFNKEGYGTWRDTLRKSFNTIYYYAVIACIYEIRGDKMSFGMKTMTVDECSGISVNIPEYYTDDINISNCKHNIFYSKYGYVSDIVDSCSSDIVQCINYKSEKMSVLNDFRLFKAALTLTDMLLATINNEDKKSGIVREDDEILTNFQEFVMRLNNIIDEIKNESGCIQKEILNLIGSNGNIENKLVKKVIMNVLIKCNLSESQYNLVLGVMYFYLVSLGIDMNEINRIPRTYTSLFDKFKREREYFDVIIEELYRGCIYYSLEADTMSTNGQEFICLIGKFTTANGQHKRQILDIGLYNYDGKSISIAKYIIKRIDLLNMKFDKCTTLTCDGASNMQGVGASIIEILASRNEKCNILEIYCFDHRLNICDQELFPDDHDIPIIIDWLNNSKRVRRWIIDNFDGKETNKRMKTIKVSSTRWCYRYFCLEFICANEKKLRMFSLLDNIATNKLKMDEDRKKTFTHLSQELDEKFKMFMATANGLKDLTQIGLEISKKLQGTTMTIIEAYNTINSYIKYVFDCIDEFNAKGEIKCFKSLIDYVISNQVNIDKEYEGHPSVRKYLTDALIRFKDKLVSRFAYIMNKLKKSETKVCNSYEEYLAFSKEKNETCFIYQMLSFINDYNNKTLKEDAVYNSIPQVMEFIKITKTVELKSNIQSAVMDLMKMPLYENCMNVLNSAILYVYSVIPTSSGCESVFSMVKNTYRPNMSMDTLFVRLCYKEALSKYGKVYNYFQIQVD